jgi:hypothetical protein
MRKSFLSGRRIAFLAGVFSGATLIAGWRPLTKEGIKAGMRGQIKLQQAAVRGMENLRDVTEEARWELASELLRAHAAANASAEGNGASQQEQDRSKPHRV